MAKKITYLNKVDTNEAIGNVVEWWRGTDANEVKDVVNSLAVDVETLQASIVTKLDQGQVEDRINTLSVDENYVDTQILPLTNEINSIKGWNSQVKEDTKIVTLTSLGDTTDPATESWSVTYNNLGILYRKAEVLTSKSKDDTYKDREFMPKEAIKELVGVEVGHSVFNVTKIQQTGGTARNSVVKNINVNDASNNIITIHNFTTQESNDTNQLNILIDGNSNFILTLTKTNNVWNTKGFIVKWFKSSGNAQGGGYAWYTFTFDIYISNNNVVIEKTSQTLDGSGNARDGTYPPAEYKDGITIYSVKNIEFITDSDSTEYTLANSVDITAPSNTAGDENAKSDVRIIEIDDIITPKYPKGQTQEVGGGEVILPDYGYSFVNLEVTWESPNLNQSIVETDLMAKGTDGSEFVISSQSTPLSNRNGAIIKSNMNYTIVNGVDVASLFLRFKLIEGDWPKLSGIKIGHITK